MLQTLNFNGKIEEKESLTGRLLNPVADPIKLFFLPFPIFAL
jgi:hypothetical protein